ncbi:hypothetical protein KS4_12330 [Poriferisphaera corsica]|uniref:Uncharacterized protein n=1 Tax=Poriferisphaera corsica TaxID=2528020 RepID=A0A517YSJ2_9BACT|nr:hypothetical protein KS4_12330 [Poriferisphaera corsica]
MIEALCGLLIVKENVGVSVPFFSMLRKTCGNQNRLFFLSFHWLICRLKCGVGNTRYRCMRTQDVVISENQKARSWICAQNFYLLFLCAMKIGAKKIGLRFRFDSFWGEVI